MVFFQSPYNLISSLFRFINFFPLAYATDKANDNYKDWDKNRPHIQSAMADNPHWLLN